MSEQPPKILVVDDVPENVRLLEAVLVPRGYEVVTATDGRAALDLVETEEPDLILLDVMMPGLDGYAVCSSLRANDDTAVLPVIMVTSSIGQEKTKAIEAGADDFIPKPFNHDELLTRVRSLLRIKRYHDTIKAQAVELAELNRTLEQRVQAQVDELERLRRLRRFLSPQLADAVVSSGDETILRSHRRQVAMFFADLRGWTSFVDAVEPEELMRVLGEFHDVIGRLVKRFDATVGFLEGDGVQLFFNDPIEIPDAALRAVQLGCALREEMAALKPVWSKRGHELDVGVGHRPRLRDLRRGRLRGPLRLRRDRGRDESRVAARRRGDGRPGADRAASVRRGRAGRRRRAGRGVHPEGVPAAGGRLRRRRGSLGGTGAVSAVERRRNALVDRGIKALEESVEQLRREADELRASRTRLVLAADADRRRIERELHDGAQQDLVALAVKLQQARGLVDSDPAAAGVLVDEMRGDVQESLDRLRSLAQRIHPPQLEAGGLPAALRSAAASAGVRVRIDVGANGVYPQEVSADRLPLHRRRVRAPRHRDDGGDRRPRRERNGGVRDRRRGRRRRPGRRASRRDPRSRGGPGRPADDHGSVGRRHADRRLAPDPRRR